MTHELSADAQAARHRELARIWLRQLACILHGFGFKEAYSRIDPQGATICLRDEQGQELRLRTAGGRWSAVVAKSHVPWPERSKLQTGGGLLSTCARVLEDAQALVLERCIKPIR